jgi:hypothetical protein
MTQLTGFAGGRVCGCFEIYAGVIGGIVATHLAATGDKIMGERFDISPPCGDVTKLAGIRGLWMGGRLISVTMTASAGAIGLSNIAVVKWCDDGCPLARTVTGFTHIGGAWMLRIFFRRRVTTGT